MPHTNPTFSAETQVLDPARPSRAGSGQQLTQPDKKQSPDQAVQSLSDRLAQAQLRFDDLGSELAHYSQQERLQLSEAVRIGLEDEISLLRKTMRRFVKAAKASGEDEYPVNLAKTLDLLGLSCGRLAGLLRVQIGLSHPDTQDLNDGLLEALQDFASQIESMKGQNDD